MRAKKRHRFFVSLFTVPTSKRVVECGERGALGAEKILIIPNLSIEFYSSCVSLFNFRFSFIVSVHILNSSLIFKH